MRYRTLTTASSGREDSLAAVADATGATGQKRAFVIATK
jgi:hypothetical protein